uniref:Uncharacterized protein n=1 Tax=Setaria italica TaxID=4555 RepID=K3ZPJ8_SETIT
MSYTPSKLRYCLQSKDYQSFWIQHINILHTV